MPSDLLHCQCGSTCNNGPPLRVQKCFEKTPIYSHPPLHVPENPCPSMLSGHAHPARTSRSITGAAPAFFKLAMVKAQSPPASCGDLHESKTKESIIGAVVHPAQPMRQVYAPANVKDNGLGTLQISHPGGPERKQFWTSKFLISVKRKIF